jgi:hypothetical protein
MLFLMGILLVTGSITLWAQTMPNLPLQDYDYHIPTNTISAITLGMGGLNLTNSADYFTSYDNPALLADNGGTAFATSFRLKSKKELQFADMMQASNLLKDKQFMYYSVVTKNAAWSYQPVASIHISQFDDSQTHSEYYDYQLDKLQLSVATKDENIGNLSGGLNLKYLTGRMVYLKERISGNSMIRESFIDNKVKGISGDLGFAWEDGAYTAGVCIYDIYSQLWWENYDSKSLKRRAALGMQYTTDDYSLMGSFQGKIGKYPDTTYHLGFVKDWTWKTENAVSEEQKEQKLIIRTGIYSKDFNGTKNINYTLGSGYNYSMFRIDFAMTNSGMKLKESQYLFSVGVGIQ